MPKKKLSVLKRARQNIKRRLRNQPVHSRIKHAVKKAREALLSKNLEAAGTLVKTTSRLLDKAASKGIIHKNTASRNKSRLQRKLAQLQKAGK